MSTRITFSSSDGYQYDNAIDVTTGQDLTTLDIMDNGYLMVGDTYICMNAKPINTSIVSTQDLNKCIRDVLFKISILSQYKVIGLYNDRFGIPYTVTKNGYVKADLPLDTSGWISILHNNNKYIIAIMDLRYKLTLISLSTDRINGIIGYNKQSYRYVIIPYEEIDLSIFVLWLLDTLFTNNFITVLNHINDIFDRVDSGVVEGITYRNTMEFYNSYINHIKSHRYMRTLSNNGNNGNVVLYLENGTMKFNNQNVFLSDRYTENNTPIIDSTNTFITMVMKIFQYRSDTYVTTNKNDVLAKMKDRYISYIVAPMTLQNQYIILLYIKESKLLVVINLFDVDPDMTVEWEFDFDVIDSPYTISMKEYSKIESGIYAAWISNVIISNIEKYLLLKQEEYELFIDVLFRHTTGLYINQYIDKIYYVNGFRGFLRSYGNNILLNVPLDVSEVEREKFILPSIPTRYYTRKYKSDVDLTLEEINKRIGSSWISTTTEIPKGFAYLFNIHPECCIVSKSTSRSLSKSYNIEPVITFKWFLTDFGTVKITLTDQSKEAIKECYEDPSKRFIIIYVILENSSGSHAGVVMYDKVTKEAERFEPHGHSSNMYKETQKIYTDFDFRTGKTPKYTGANVDDVIKTELSELVPLSRYYPPEEYCPQKGFQLLEEKEKYVEREPGGYCAAWVIFYLDLRLSNPDMTRNEVIDLAMKKIKDKISFREFIRDYSDFLANY